MNSDDLLRRFKLERTEDVSGVSGTGVVAVGVEVFDKRCYVFWLGNHSSHNEYNSIQDVEFVHGHSGLTKVVWIDNN